MQRQGPDGNYERTVIRYDDMTGAGPGWMPVACNLTFTQASQIRDGFNAANLPRVWCVMRNGSAKTVIRCDNTAGAGPGWTLVDSGLTWPAATGEAFGTPASPLPPGATAGGGTVTLLPPVALIPTRPPTSSASAPLPPVQLPGAPPPPQVANATPVPPKTPQGSAQWQCNYSDCDPAADPNTRLCCYNPHFSFPTSSYCGPVAGNINDVGTAGI